MTRYLLTVVALLLVLTANVEASADVDAGQVGKGMISELRVGVLSHDVGVFANSHESGFDVNLDIYFTSPSGKLSRALYSPRPLLGISAHSEGQTHQIYGGVAWDLKFAEPLFFTLGGGVAIHTGELESSDPDEQRLGSRVLFRFSINAGLIINEKWNVSYFWGHISNAHLAEPNCGLDTMGVQLGYVF